MAKENNGRLIDKAYRHGKKAIYGTLIGYGLLILASISGAFVGKNYYDEWNNKIDGFNASISRYFYSSVEDKLKENKIGAKHADELKQKADSYKMNAGFLNLLDNIINKKFYLIREVWYNPNNPDVLKKLEEEANTIIGETDRKKLEVQNALERLDSKWDFEGVEIYGEKLGNLKADSIDTGLYEIVYEEIYFSYVGNQVIKKINKDCAKGCNPSKIIKAGNLFARLIKENYPEKIDLELRTKQLSEHISNGLIKNSPKNCKECRVDFREYLN